LGGRNTPRRLKGAHLKKDVEGVKSVKGKVAKQGRGIKLILEENRVEGGGGKEQKWMSVIKNTL